MSLKILRYYDYILKVILCNIGGWVELNANGDLQMLETTTGFNPRAVSDWLAGIISNPPPWVSILGLLES